jgi:hypothetical protein
MGILIFSILISLHPASAGTAEKGYGVLTRQFMPNVV